MAACLPRISKEESDRVQALVGRALSVLSDRVISESMELMDHLKAEEAGKGGASLVELVLTRMWVDLTPCRMFYHDTMVELERRTLSRLFYYGLLLAATASSSTSVDGALSRLGDILKERGGDYGSLVLVELGHEYTRNGIRAKLLRLAHRYQQDQRLLLDECLDIAGYAVLHLVVLWLDEEKRKEEKEKGHEG